MEKEKQAGFKNYAVIDPIPKTFNDEVSDFEKTLILDYLRSVFGKTLSEDDNDIEISTINNSFFYDSYSIFFQKNGDFHKYVLKISLDPENDRLKIENTALSSVDSLVSPSVVDHTHDTENDVEFLLISWENGENFEYYGDDDLMYNIGTFSSVLDVIHSSDTTDLRSFKDVFAQNETITSIKDLADEQEIEIFQKLVDLTFDDIDSILQKIKDDFLPQYTEEIKVLCHSNLKHSNILYQNGHIKVVNFENSHSSDIYYSLLKFVNNSYLYYSDKKTKTFLSKYYKFSRVLGDLDCKTFIKNYESKKELNRIFLFQDLLCKIILHFFAYGAFSRKKTLTHYMYLYLNIKPTIEKYFPDKIKSLDKLFFTTMPTVETYNLKELQSILDIKD